MRRIYPLFLIALVLHPAVARAESPLAAEASGRGDLAVGVNVPTSWLVGSVSASTYVGLAPHHALRANFARFHVDNSIWPIRLIASGFESAEPVGTIYDVGLSWVWYERGLWDGLMLEAGVLRRDRDTVYWPEFAPKTETDTVAYGARAMIGWSWRVGSYGFIAAAIGGSVGRESGKEHVTEDDWMAPTVTRSVQRVQTDLETYVRWGIGFGD